MSHVQVDSVTVTYGTTVAVRNVTFEVADGEIVALLGPSGCGKSTLLRAIGGLEPLASGTIRLDGVDVTDVAPHHRGVGLMFQDHALFPHRSVAENVGFGPRMQGLSRADIATRVEEALTLVDLTHTTDRAVWQLSGGEQQRVALARAIAPRPGVLMLDEPLGALDRALRSRLLDELPQLLRSLGTTVLYVTHDQDEALGIADRIAVMRAGEFSQVATPETIWRRPESRFVATFIGLDQQFSAARTGDDVTTSLGTFRVPHLPESAGTRGWLVCLPDAWQFASTSTATALPRFSGTVVGRQFAADHLRARVRLDADGSIVRVPVGHRDAPLLDDQVEVDFDPTATWFVAEDRRGDEPLQPADGVAPPARVNRRVRRA